MATPDSDLPPISTPRVQDRRSTPQGVLPRRIQTWLMAGLAAVILLIILITGRSAPTPRSSGALPPSPIPATADRIRNYQRQLEEEQRRQVQLDQQQAAVDARPSAATKPPVPVSTPDPGIEEQKRRELRSLFADNVAFTRRTVAVMTRPASDAPAAPTTNKPVERAEQTSTPASDTDVAPSEHTTNRPTSTAAAEAPHREYPAAGPRLRLVEGTFIETTLVNRLDGTFTGPVECLVTTPVYSQDRQHILIPAGARVLGKSAPVQNWGESRLAVTFHRLVMPDGHTYTLDQFKGLDQIGATGLRDQVNRHYLQVFGASVAIGAIAGLAQYNTRSGIDYTFSDAYRQAAGASLATSASRVLDRYLNVLPTITIREGFRIKVYLTNDLELPAYGEQGGVR
jgi:type IV secretion system protein VirB10